MQKLFAKLTLLAALFSLPLVATAQDQASMTGVVSDATGAVIPGTSVTLRNPNTGVKFTQTTNAQGSYRFVNLPPNRGYIASFAHGGFSTAQVSNLTLDVGITRTLDAKLTAGTDETIEVSAGNQTVTLDTTDASIGNNIDVEQLNQLPVQDRTAGITTLFVLQPGVDIFQGAVTGARIDQTETTLDGLDVNDVAAGTTFAIVGNAPVDSVQQFTGTVAGLNPSIGTGSGGQFQLVTKSGTNQFHGNINEYHRDTTTAANTYFNNLVGLPRTPLIRNQFGGNIGGPIKRDKLFFFFDFADSRIIQSQSAERTVPLDSYRNGTLNYINSNPGCGDDSRLNTTPNCITNLSAAQVKALDPAGIGFSSDVLAFINSRYPHANDLSQGDGVNTGGYRFTTPTPDFETTYVGRVDYNLTSKQKIYGRFTINRNNATSVLPEIAADGITHPEIDRSYGYVVSHVWQIGQNKVNQFYYGDNISKLSFPDLFNPTGANQYSFTGLSGPYTSYDGQQRRVPIPVVRDDFNWQLGSHSLTMGGTFKFVKTNSNLVNNFNFPEIGLAGTSFSSGLDASSHPADLNMDANSVGINDFDQLFATGLGVIGAVSTNYNYNNAGTAQPAGSGGPRAYRFYQTEAYLGDTWKVNKELTLSYGVRYQFYTVPYEAHGEESVPVILPSSGSGSGSGITLSDYVADRLKQSSAGDTSPTGLPFYSIVLGGKANNGPNLYAPSYKDFAPRFAFAYNPSYSPKTVINGSAAVVYDRSVINAINFLQDQISYLFSNSQINNLGTGGPATALANAPRVGAGLSYSPSLIPAPAALSVPYTPYVDPTLSGSYGGIATGLSQGQTNFVVNPNLKDPYSIALNLGVQQEFPGHLIMKLNYAGRLGRRLLADADAGQVIDFPAGGQSLSAAFASLTTQLRAGANPRSAAGLAAQPWFETVAQPGLGKSLGFANNTSFVAYLTSQLAKRGDVSDVLYDMAAYTAAGYPLLPPNVGIPSQFGSNTYLTNQGNSNYHGLLLTVSKNLSQGLRFDFNYTWSHSIDNTSLSANNNSLFSNSGFICDILQPRACRGNSDFDVTQEISSDFTYNLPFGHGRTFLASAPKVLDEVIGGWGFSGIPKYRTGLATTAYSDTYLASFDNQDPAIFTGNPADLRVSVNKEGSTVFAFKGGAAGAAKVLSEFRGPIGLEYGQRNLLRGPGAFYLDAGLEKNFPIIEDRVRLQFRADAFNLFNHPVFAQPNVNIVTNASQFGQITGTQAASGSGNIPLDDNRVGQFSLRLEF